MVGFLVRDIFRPELVSDVMLGVVVEEVRSRSDASENFAIVGQTVLDIYIYIGTLTL